MTNGKKCPNCGYETTEDFCPNCDVFNNDIPTVKKEEPKREKNSRVTPRETNAKLNEEAVLRPKMQAAIEKNKIEKFQLDREKAKLEEEQQHTAEQEVPKEEKTKKLPDSTKKGVGKWVAIVVAFLLIVGGGVFAYKQQQKQQEENRLAEVTKESKKIKKDLAALYCDEEQLFLSEDFEEKALIKIMKRIDGLGDKKAQKDLEPIAKDLASRYAKQKEVNDLFENNIIVGNHLGEATIKPDVVLIPEKYEDSSDEFVVLLNKGLEEARIQNDILSNAKIAMDKVFDADVKPEVTRPLYDEAKASVEKVKSVTIRQEFQDKLVKVETFLKDKEAKEKEEKAKKEKEAKEKEAAAEANGEGPWAWEPGIKEKVINECLRRGYIVEGGYYLEKKEVRDGEGYYDLYASNTESSLLKDRSPEAVPIYLVTINCKTGWFKGNGPN